MKFGAFYPLEWQGRFTLTVFKNYDALNNKVCCDKNKQLCLRRDTKQRNEFGVALGHFCSRASANIHVLREYIIKRYFYIKWLFISQGH